MDSISFGNTNDNNTKLSGISVSSHYLTKQGVVQNSNLDNKLHGAQLENRQRRDTLTSALNARPDMQELLDAGYISEYGNKMADSLQPAVLALEETLVQNFSETQEY